MNLSALPLSPAWLIATWGLAALLLLFTLRHTDWKRLTQRYPSAIWHGGILFATLLWSLRATIDEQFTFHLLGMAVLTLTLGAPLALLAALVVVTLHTLIHDGAWANLALSWLALCAFPIGLSYTALRLAERRLPPHLFIYLLVVSYFATGFALIATGLLSLLITTLIVGLPLGNLFDAYTLPLILLSFGEASMTGMLITIGVVYWPQWVSTFNDSHYLKPR